MNFQRSDTFFQIYDFYLVENLEKNIKQKYQTLKIKIHMQSQFIKI